MSLRSRVMIEVASNNPIGPSIGMAGTSSSISRTPKRVRSTIWQHFRQVKVTKNEKKIIKALYNYCERVFYCFYQWHEPPKETR